MRLGQTRPCEDYHPHRAAEQNLIAANATKRAAKAAYFPSISLSPITSQVRLAEAHLQKALTQYEKAMQTAVPEVSEARVEYRRVKEVCTQQEWLVTAVREQASCASMRYHGSSDILRNTLDADRDLCHAELSLVQTRRNELLALVQLYKTMRSR